MHQEDRPEGGLPEATEMGQYWSTKIAKEARPVTPTNIAQAILILVLLLTLYREWHKGDDQPYVKETVADE